MAFNVKRFSVLSGGQSGSSIFVYYDGSGTDAEGGDTLFNVTLKNFIRGEGRDFVMDIFRKGSDGRTTGVGIPFLARGRNGMEVNLLHLAGDGEFQVATGDWQNT